jgi:large subunit ribosomal protein L25
MTEFIELKTAPRDVLGKAARRLAPEGLIPGILYGHGVEPTSVSIDRHEFELLMVRETLSATVLEVTVGDGEKVNAIVKSLQKHPVKGSVLHIDLLAIDMKATITTPVPVSFVGDSEGVKEGGILTQTLTEILIECLPTDLPDSIEVDIARLGIGDNVHVSDLVAPEGVTIQSDPDGIVVSITLPKAVEEEEPEDELLEGEEAAEGEAAKETEDEGAKPAGDSSK